MLDSYISVVSQIKVKYKSKSAVTEGEGLQGAWMLQKL